MNILLEQEEKPKAIIMAGGAGVGKTFVTDKFKKAAESKGWVVLNPDQYARNPDPKQRLSLAAAASKINKEVDSLAKSKDKPNIIWDTTANNPTKVKELQDAGYDVLMIMVYAHPSVAFEQNFARASKKGEDSLPPYVVLKTWADSYNDPHIENYQKMFGDNFIIVDNTSKPGIDNSKIDAFNKAAQQGGKALEKHIGDIIKSDPEYYSSTQMVSKPANLSKDQQDDFDSKVQQLGLKLEEDDREAMEKLYQKYFEKNNEAMPLRKVGRRNGMEEVYKSYMSKKVKKDAEKSKVYNDISASIKNIGKSFSSIDDATSKAMAHIGQKKLNELTQFLVDSILNETTEKVVALFGGGFKPPTKGHLDVVNNGIKQNPEVTEVKILVGGKERDGFTQDQAVKIWNLYNDLNFIGKPATIIPVSSPFSYYKNYLKDNPDDKVYIFIGSREGDEDDKFDVKQRSEFVKKYSDNVVPVEVATTGGVSGTLARKLFKKDIDSFRNMFPENLLDIDFQKILDILNNKSTDNTRKSAPKSTEPLTPLNEGDPKKGTGKKPKGSGRRLYTDEDPSDTVGVKFSTRQDIVDTLNKKSFKAKSHARQSQIINLIHQRVRAALSRTKDPAKKKKLKSGFEYIKGKKEASKKKTQRLKKQKLKENLISNADLNLVGNVLRDKNKAEEIHNLLLQMFPEYKEALETQYKNDSYAEFKEFIFNIDKYKLEGPKLVPYTKLKIAKDVEDILTRDYKKSRKDKNFQFFRDDERKPEDMDFSKIPPITIDSNGFVVDGNHRAFLAIKKQKPLKAYQIVKTNHEKENKERAEKILNIVGRKKQEENIDPKSQAKHKGKAAPFGSAYEKVKESTKFARGKVGTRYRSIEKRGDKYYYTQDDPLGQGIRQEFGPYKTKAAAKRKMGTFPPAQNYRDITEFIDKIIDEKLCKRGYNYIAKRKREGEKHNPFLTARAVKVCKGQISGSDGKKKKDFRPKKGKKRSAQGRKPNIVKEIGIDLTNYDGQILPGDVLRAPKGFPLGGKKLESSKQLKVIKNSREGVNRYKLSLEDKDGKKYSVRNFEMDGEYKGKKLPKWGLVRKSKKNINEIDYDSIFRTEAYLKTKLTDRDQGDILSDIRSLPGVTIVGSKDVPNRPSKEESILSIKVDPYPFTQMDDVSAPEAVDYISTEIRKIKGVERFQVLKKRVSETKPLNENENKEYFDFQIRIKNDSYDNLGTTFNNMGGRIQKSSTSVGGNPLIFNYRNVPSLVKAAFKAKNDNSEILIYNDEGKGKVYPLTTQNIKLIKRPTSLNENATYTNHIDFKQQIRDLTKHMIKKGMNILPLPRVIFKHSDTENASKFLGKTAYYSPSDTTIVLYTEGRHPKDIARSFAHEMIHHIQHLEGRLHDINTTNTNDDDHLNDIEREAYTRGNMVFRNWTDGLDGEEVTSLNEGPQFGVLYHFTQFLPDVLDDNMLRGPVSLTRSKDSFVTEWLGDQPYFILDKDKLRTKYKIRPYKDTSDDPDYEPISYYDEMEEVIDTNVTNLSKYIIKVVLPEPNEEYENALKEKGIPYEIDKPLNEKKKPYKHKSGFNDKLGKDPFGLNQFAREIMGETEKPIAESVEKQKEVRIFNKDCGCDKT